MASRTEGDVPYRPVIVMLIHANARRFSKIYVSRAPRSKVIVTLQSPSQLEELIVGLGVTFTLIYLAIQVRSNTWSQRADMTARVL